MNRVFASAMLVSAVVSTSYAQGLPSAKPEDVGLSGSELGKIHSQLQVWVDSGRLPGVTAVVARHGKVAYVTSAGSLDSAGTRPIAVDDVFRILSMTKPITTTAIMQLVERGKIHVGDPVSKFIPAFAAVKVYAGGSADHPMLVPPTRPVTIADLLTHTSGLIYGTGNKAVDTIYHRANVDCVGCPGYRFGGTLAQFADSIARLPLAFQPGTKWDYGLSHDVLGRVVEVASGQTFDAYLDSAIFRPLGMSSTAFHATPAMTRHLTRAFEYGPEKRLHVIPPTLGPEYTDSGIMLSGGGGLLSAIPDYLRFAQMLLNRGTLDGHRVLRPEAVDLMMTNHIPLTLTPIHVVGKWPPGQNGFGYGGAIRLDEDSAKVPGNKGTFRWSGAGTTFFWIDPKADIIAMLWSQYSSERHIWDIDEAFQRLVYAAIR
jgi:CubicO group peptidase (beta-lactamase class C family)